MKVLLTGFDPFGGESVNPAFEAIKLLPSTIAGAEIVYVEIPTEFKKSAQAVEAAIKEHNPDIVINVGQAGGRSCVTVEKVGINLQMPGFRTMQVTSHLMSHFRQTVQPDTLQQFR